MQRRTAILLMLVALVGTFVPLALAATAAPSHACCIRKAHHCHDSEAAVSNELAIRGTSRCNHDCCHAVTVSQWAHPQPRSVATRSQQIGTSNAAPHPTSSSAERHTSQSPRAPPQVSET